MNKIYVGNLPLNTTEQKLQDQFGKYGEISEPVLLFLVKICSKLTALVL